MRSRLVSTVPHGVARWSMLIGVTLLLTGCLSTGRHSVMAKQSAYQPRADSALLIVMRPSSFGGAISSSVFDVIDDSEQLLGIVGTGEKMAFYVAPGAHRFMIIAENADFMEADLQAGKVYYAIITPRLGLLKSRFSMHPFKRVAGEDEFLLHSGELLRWLASCHFVEPAYTAQEWMADNAASIRKKRIEYTASWEAMLEEDKRWRRIEPQDGLDQPL